MDRRAFLLSVSTLALSQVITGCGTNQQLLLNVQLLKNSIPGQVVKKFRKTVTQGGELKFTPIDQLEDLFKLLQTWQQPPTNQQKEWTSYLPFNQNQRSPTANLVTLGDYWLEAAISQELIQPLETKNLKNIGYINDKWQQIIKRDQNGKIWGVPYRWGNTVIIYNREKFQKLGWTPTDWSDLWRSELQNRISLLNHPREVVGLVLKKLGKSYNTENLNQISSLETELQALNQQVKFYNSTNYLEPLIIGDTWLAVGWSDEIIPVISRYQKFAAIVPKSGTAIWADLWVSPVGVNNDDLAYQWLDFCLQPHISKQIALLTKSNSPIQDNMVMGNIEIQNLLLTNAEIFAKSEFLLPLPPAVMKEYEDLFMKMKQS
ncbi:extracellular solute-binding protein [Aphanizomenon flos-aquae NRERC-008]|uniref:Extracellular solute-binding protein n=1 Tax=Aphanizomenon flos-aquae FACHB-1249 TaxID=2692889 RepID=A0ABR8IQC0_APHFL|nr:MULTISPECIES: extracellular solute-binding protein [Aphanizomenon]MBD2390908.1 extracellular solute-binding protein [Aphanizomenon flos-aquae FACHB-1171]MBD2556826.1 extracellular solute-binding protein [Aphanizomenon flos-aquae FACHB-1290]MBD2631622.1 extracellular solute-binding protein [Aphanizomenon sp. FACHB-1399]MBD2642556.1 extracellular solute-binding protein [Aphanizomenon sp. FACHB-1401]MBD2657617.1 extracellular solute-binding protein [Aphanizomenon flos-aquae FACHB-1265]